MAGPYFRQGSSSRPINQQLVRIQWEDGSESHVTPEHAANIRAQAASLKKNNPNYFTKGTRNPLNPTGYEANG